MYNSFVCDFFPQLGNQVSYQYGYTVLPSEDVSVKTKFMQWENYDIIAITETWWDNSHNWSAAMEVLQWMAINSSEGIGKEGEGVG